MDLHAKDTNIQGTQTCMRTHIIYLYNVVISVVHIKAPHSIIYYASIMPCIAFAHNVFFPLVRSDKSVAAFDKGRLKEPLCILGSMDQMISHFDVAQQE